MMIDSELLLKRLRSLEEAERNSPSAPIEGSIRIDLRVQGITLSIKAVEQSVAEIEEAEQAEKDRMRALVEHARHRGAVQVAGRVGRLVNVMQGSGKCKVLISGHHFTFPGGDVEILKSDDFVLAGPR